MAKAKLHDPGGKVKLRLKDDVVSTAVFGGKKREYRYTLHRVWDSSLPAVMFVMMNPSVADVDVDDPTVARCQTFAREWGYGQMYVANTFAYRATDQKQLMAVKDPVGPENDRHILEMAAASEMIVLAYGQPHKALRERGADVAKLLREHGYSLHALKLCKDGTPGHPLYLRGDAKPFLT